MSYEDLMNHEDKGISSSQLRALVEKARERQKKRFGEKGLLFNAEIPPADLGELCPLSYQAEKLLERAFERMKFSARVVHRLIRVARTAADLDESEEIKDKHIREAMVFRSSEMPEEYEKGRLG